MAGENPTPETSKGEGRDWGNAIPTADVEEADINPVCWKSQLYVTLWAVGAVAAFVVDVVLRAAVGVSGAIILYAVATGVPAVIAFFVAHWGFIFDGRAVGKSFEHEWRPWWWAYFLGSWLTLVVVVAPIYLYRRHKKTGEPDWEDVRRKISLRGAIIPWH